MSFNTTHALGRPPITHFAGRFRFLSNFYPAPMRFRVHGEDMDFPTSEHAYQACKCDDFQDSRAISHLQTPGQAKEYGGRIKMRPGWEDTKIMRMRDILLVKFATHSPLREALLGTADAELVEGNTWGDKFWGKVDGVGENWLGRMLMFVRTEYRSAAIENVLIEEHSLEWGAPRS